MNQQFLVRIGQTAAEFFNNVQGMVELEWFFTEFLDELIEWSKGRYKSISKTFEDFDEFQDGGETVVYSTGMLNGEALDGSAIREVRYIDRFVFRDGLMVDQQVWNDLADVLPKSPAS